MSSNRKSVADGLHEAARNYLVKKMFSVHHEVGIEAWGKRRADLFAFSTKLDVVICEVKSCAADFDTDHKWIQYIPYCHRFYFVISQAYWDSAQADRLRDAAKEHGAGVLVLGARGILESKINSKSRTTLPEGFAKRVITKLAWRNGAHRGNTRPGRVFI